MNKIALLILMFFYLIACNNKSEEEKIQYTIDSLKIMQNAHERNDSLIKSIRKNRLLDTTGISKSPILILKSQIVEIDYSNKKNIRLIYKNVSNKKITAIRFEWYGENAFNEPAEMGSYTSPGEGGGFTEQLLAPGKTNDSEWDIYSKDAKKVITARAYEVAFSDGTSWKLHPDQ